MDDITPTPSHKKKKKKKKKREGKNYEDTAVENFAPGLLKYSHSDLSFATIQVVHRIDIRMSKNAHLKYSFKPTGNTNRLMIAYRF
jgi:hypothetical protein